MNSRGFKVLAAQERKAKLIKVLMSKTQGKLSKQSLERIANYATDDQELIINTQMTISVHTDVKEFAGAVTLQDCGMEHSWAGSRTTTDFGYWIIGKGKFGLNRYMEYSNNGNMSSPTIKKLDPEFNVDEIQCVYKRTDYRDSYNGNDKGETNYFLHILMPNSTMKIESEIQEIMNRFNI